MNSPCALCGATRSLALFEGRDWLHAQPTQAKILRCEECGLVYLWPKPSRPLDSYPEDYAPYLGQPSEGDIVHSPGHRGGVLRKATLASQYHTGPLLDIGCAAGEFLSAVDELDDGTLLGTDISRKAVWHARQRLGLDVWVGNVPGLPLLDGSLSIVTLWHVLEHLSDPVAALSDIRRVLSPEGVLVVACPMADSWEAKVFGRYWSGYDVPRHLFTFSRQTLPRLLREAGFEPVEVRHVVRGYNSAKISSSFWLQGIPILRKHPELLRLAASLMAGPAALAFSWLSWLLGNRGAVGVFVAHKRPGGEAG